MARRWPIGTTSAERYALPTYSPTHCWSEDREQSSPLTSRSSPSRNPATQQHGLCPRSGSSGVQLGTNCFFMEMVDHHDAATLVPIIQHYILRAYGATSGRPTTTWMPLAMSTRLFTVDIMWTRPLAFTQTTLRQDGRRASPVSNAGMALRAPPALIHWWVPVALQQWTAACILHCPGGSLPPVSTQCNCVNTVYRHWDFAKPCRPSACLLICWLTFFGLYCWCLLAIFCK